MKASINRLDAVYEVEFRRPAFSRVTSFVEILEPLYDTFSREVRIPSDAIRIENGDSISTAGITFDLFSGKFLFEIKLDGYKAEFYDLHSKEDTELAKRYAMLFEEVVSEFMKDGYPQLWKILVPCWISIKDPNSVEIAEQLIRNLTWLPDSHDPFEIGASSVSSLVKFDCVNFEELWSVGILLNKSVLPESDLFVDFSGEYMSGTQFESFDQKIEHLSSVSASVFNKLGLTLE